MALSFPVWEAHSDDEFVIDKSLVRKAALKATGADIHDVNDLLAAYQGACELVTDLESRLQRPNHQLSSEKKILFTNALRWRRIGEVSLRAYVAGMPIKEAMAYANRAFEEDNAADTGR